MEVLIVFAVIFSIPILLLIALAIWAWKYGKDRKEELEAEEAEREKRTQYIMGNCKFCKMENCELCGKTVFDDKEFSQIMSGSKTDSGIVAPIDLMQKTIEEAIKATSDSARFRTEED